MDVRLHERGDKFFLTFSAHMMNTLIYQSKNASIMEIRNFFGLSLPPSLCAGVIGTELREGYDALGLEMSKPRLRTEVDDDADSPAAPRCGVM